MSWFRNRVAKRKNLVYLFRGAPAHVRSLPDGFEFAELNRDLVERYFQAPEDAERKARYLRFLELGYRGFMVHEGEQWAAVAWLVPAEVPGMPPHLPARVTAYPWLSEAHTLPQYRRRGLHQFLLNKRLSILAEENPGAAVTAMSDVNPANTASRRSHIAEGFEPAGWVYAWLLRIPRVPSGPYGWRCRMRKHPRIMPSTPRGKQGN